MDFVPNHSSDEHEWFEKSVQQIDPYTNYYIWKDAKIDENGLKVPPNNWVRFLRNLVISFILFASLLKQNSTNNDNNFFNPYYSF